MTNSDKTHAINSETGIVSEIPVAWLELFPSLTEASPEDECIECAMDLPADIVFEKVQEEDPEKPTPTSKGSKK